MKPVFFKHAVPNPGHYVPAVISRGMLYISGQLPKDPETGTIPEGGIKPQMRQALSTLDSLLAAAGTDRFSVVQCRVYIPDMNCWDEINRLYAEFFWNHMPARVVVPTRSLHYGALVEIEAVAEL